MKLSLLTVLALLFSTAAFAKSEPQEIKCKLYDQYTSIDVTKSFYLDDEWIRVLEDGKVEVNYSETECEDSSEVVFEKEAYEALKKGEEVYGEFDHAGPDLRIQGTVSCVLAKK